jgi:DNA helicase-2/ATP-dependent DNA helicase PcrA
LSAAETTPDPGAAEPPAYLAGLNEAQREAVLHEGAPLLILAGAGSGKTRVITSKIAHLLEARGYPPEAILAVAFTNKAAEEMRERVRRYSPAGAEVMIKTFHAFGAWLLRRHGEAIGLARDFTIYDEEDSLALLRAAVEGRLDRDLLRSLAARISRAKDRCLSPEDDLSGLSLGELAAEVDFAQAYRLYQERLRSAGCLDFGDLLLESVRLLSTQPEVRSRLQSRFRAVLVDEYQDSNHAQFRLLQLLHHPSNYLCAVGDEDQSIYSFRGAELDNILGFAGHFPGTRIVRLEQNYRSAANILEAATRVVEHNRRRLGKTLWTRKPAGAPVELGVLEDQDEEARFCAGQLADGELAGSAILYRMNFQSRPFETLFTRLGIPFRVVGTVRFYEREEVKDALAYLSLAANPRDEMAFRRAVNRPRRGVGARSVEAVLALRGRTAGNLLEAAEQAAALAGGARGFPKGLAAFLKVTAGLREALERQPPSGLHQVVLDLLTDSGLLAHYRERDLSEDTDRQRNLSELVNATTEFPGTREGLSRFLEGVMLNSLDENPFAPAGKVTLITVHNTKGLEFDRVFLTGLEEGIFPHYASTAGQAPVSGEELEEERRLFYVGATRARERLLLTCCRRRRVFGAYQSVEASRFLSEVPAALLRVHGREAPGGPAERFPPGCQVYHEDYGPGVVTRAWTVEGQPMIAVRFDSGRIARFPVKYNSLERVSRET